MHFTDRKDSKPRWHWSQVQARNATLTSGVTPEECGEVHGHGFHPRRIRMIILPGLASQDRAAARIALLESDSQENLRVALLRRSP